VSKRLDADTIFRVDEIKIDLGSKKVNDDKGKEREYERLWNKCLEIIKDNINPQAFRTWFEPITAISWNDNKLIVNVPSQFFCEWIEEHYYPLLKKTIRKVFGEITTLQYKINLDQNGAKSESKAIKLPALKYPPPVKQEVLPFSNDVPTFVSNLNPRYSFDNFVRGESNQLASSASLAVSNAPGKTSFNPLVIYGDNGLGKTHLAQSIGNGIIQKNPRAKVLYTTSEQFTMDYVQSLQNNKLNDFIQYYRKVDTLIVDDIQFLGGKEKTQDHFFHTFNALHQMGKQLVLTSDKPPKDLKDVDTRLISRFHWGLVADIQPPDLEMRMAILQKKSNDEGIELPIEVIEYFARNIKASIRELEGSLIKMIAKVSFEDKEINLELAEEIVRGNGFAEDKPLTIEDIRELVSKHYNIAIDDMISKCRKHEIALARQMAMYLSKKYTQHSLKSIGSYFGNRDHSTVLHSCQTIENYIVTDKSVKLSFETLKSKLNH
jgi:chromosomal replication initiator protein